MNLLNGINHTAFNSSINFLGNNRSGKQNARPTCLNRSECDSVEFSHKALNTKKETVRKNFHEAAADLLNTLEAEKVSEETKKALMTELCRNYGLALGDEEVVYDIVMQDGVIKLIRTEGNNEPPYNDDCEPPCDDSEVPCDGEVPCDDGAEPPYCDIGYEEPWR